MTIYAFKHLFSDTYMKDRTSSIPKVDGIYMLYPYVDRNEEIEWIQKYLKSEETIFLRDEWIETHNKRWRTRYTKSNYGKVFKDIVEIRNISRNGNLISIIQLKDNAL